MRKWLFKHVLTTACAFFSANIWAVAPGLYMGLMFGATTNDAKPQLLQVKEQPPFVPPPATTLGKPRGHQYGTRFFLGYKINKYAGYEFGLDYYSTIAFEPSQSFKNSGLDTCSASNARVYAVDFVGLASFPFGDWFEIYGKAGAAGTYLTLSGDLAPDGTRDCGRNQRSAKIKPTVSLGADMSLSQNWVIDASWNRLAVGSVVNNITYYALGFSYHFVDKYCGQFLCDD